MAPRRAPRNQEGGNADPNVAQLVNEQLMASLPNIITQVAAGLQTAQANQAQGNANHPPRCTYKAFMSCKPGEFKGSEGAVGLLHWVEGMETVLNISKCAEEDKVEYASCQLRDRAQTWWKNQIQVRGREAANQLTWGEFVNLLTEEYCSKDEKQKLENELWNHSMVGADIDRYTVRFHELARLVPHMVTPEETRIDRYIWGLAPEIRGMVTSANLTTIQSAVVLANRLTNDLIRSGVFSKNNPNNKRKVDAQIGNEVGHGSNKNLKRARNFGATTRKANESFGSSPWCKRCNQYHQGGCRRCFKCNRKGHHADQCVKSTRVCYECGSPNHLRNDCPRPKRGLYNNTRNQTNQKNHESQARGRAFVIGAEESAKTP